jgi:hypothetical protein
MAVPRDLNLVPLGLAAELIGTCSDVVTYSSVPLADTTYHGRTTV